MRANRLVAGLGWLVAGVAGVVAEFCDIYVAHSGPVELTATFWEQTVTSGGRTLPGAEIAHGVNLLIGAVLALVGGILLCLPRLGRTGAVAGAFGTGALVAVDVQWLVIVGSTQPSSFEPQVGFWLLVAAAVVGLVGLVASPVERTRPAGQPPRWEPPTPRFGVPAQGSPAQPYPPRPGQPPHAGQFAPPFHPTQPAQPAPPARAERSAPAEPPTPPEGGATRPAEGTD
jgi:hypothetical protein